MGDIAQDEELVTGDNDEAGAGLLPVVYEELRMLAAVRMANDSDTSTLQPTALVHEVWLRVAGLGGPNWKSRAHFFAPAAEAMRRILIDRARRRHSFKREAGAVRADLERVDLDQEKSTLAVLWRHGGNLEMSERPLDRYSVVWSVSRSAGTASPEHVDVHLAGWIFGKVECISGRLKPTLAAFSEVDRLSGPRAWQHVVVLG